MARRKRATAILSKGFVSAWTASFVQESGDAVHDQGEQPSFAVDVVKLLGRPAPRSESASARLIKSLRRSLDDSLGGRGIYWSETVGQIAIHCPERSRKAALQRQAAVMAAVQHMLRDRSARPSTRRRPDGGAVSPDVPRRLDWESFQAQCAAAQQDPEQVLVLDVSEILCGAANPDLRLSRRVWSQVDKVVDQQLAAGGYCTRYPGNKLLLLFPGLTTEAAEARRDELATAVGEGVLRPALPRAEPIAAPAPATPPPAAAPPPQAAAPIPKETEARKQPTFSCRLVPVWHATNRTLVGQTVELSVPHNGSVPGGGSPEGTPHDELDPGLLNAAIEQAREAVRLNNPFIAIAPLPWDILEERKLRESCLAILARVDEPARRLLVLSLTDIPEDMLGSRVFDRLALLRPFCRAITCRASLERRSFSGLARLDFHAVGLDLGQADYPESTLMRALDLFQERVEPLRLRTFVHGLRTTSLVIAALASGFDYLSGTALQEVPGLGSGIRQFTIPDIYRRAPS